MCVVWGHNKIATHRKAGKVDLSVSFLDKEWFRESTIPSV